MTSPVPTPTGSTGTLARSFGHDGTRHYENFPVASWLCPPALRPAVRAIYHFARTADDMADEGHASPDQRLFQLQQFRRCLALAAQQHISDHPDDWPGVFAPLAQAIRQHQLPLTLLDDLLSAFEQDVRHTASGHRYADTTELLAYCQLSANPVGRLLLHLMGISDDTSLRQSDAICSALQLINFWQDLSVDLARQRHYLPDDVLQRHKLGPDDFAPTSDSGAAARVVAELCAHARALMNAGAPLACRVPGRMGWELRLVVQGGLRLLDHIERMGHASWRHRPTLRAHDLPVLLWRALRMR